MDHVASLSSISMLTCWRRQTIDTVETMMVTYPKCDRTAEER
jgi:hypothetical protein